MKQFKKQWLWIGKDWENDQGYKIVQVVDILDMQLFFTRFYHLKETNCSQSLRQHKQGIKTENKKYVY